MKYQLTGLAVLTGSLSVLQAIEEAPVSNTLPASVPAPELVESVASSKALGFFVAPNIGTLGVGLEAGYECNSHLKLRARSNWIGYDFDETRQDILYKAKAQNVSGGLFLDYHPWAGTFRVTAGLLISNLNAKADGSKFFDNETLTIGGETYTAKGDVYLHGKYEWNKVQPYIGIGWSTDGQGDRSWYFTADIGVAILGKGKFTTSYTGDVTDGSGDPVPASQIHQSLEREMDEVLKVCDKLTVYPVVQIGVGYRF